MTEQPPNMLAAALRWSTNGCSVIRVRADGTKATLGTWKDNQYTPASADTLTAWFGGGHPGLGIVCGAVSGGLELFELEGRAVEEGLVAALAATCADHGIADVWATISQGCAVMSPSGGLHLFYRVTGGVDGNTKLAQRHARDDEYTDEERARLAERGTIPRRVLIETRGEGGFVVAAPSHGTVHPSGIAWRWAVGGPETIPTITADQRDALHIAACTLDQLPPPPPIPEPTVLDTDRPGGIAPGADYNERGTWNDLLIPHGWTPLRRGATDTRTYWTRPGKTRGVSAVTGGEHGDFFWCWSSSTELPQEQALSKWRVYALLEHGGDFHAAAAALRRRGYGQAAPPPTRPVLTVLPQPQVDGTAAVQPAPATEPAAATLAYTDDGNALALVDSYGDRIRYCAERGRWLWWTGQRWEWCASGGGQVREWAKAVARAIPEIDNTAVRHKQRSLSALGTTAMLTQAATDSRIVVRLDDLDAHPWELNTPGGIVDLRTGELRPADPAHLHTRITTVSPDLDAAAPRWAAFLADTFAGHGEELPVYLQRLVGYSATGVVREHVLPFAFGGGANGKGVFLETLRTVLGDYATTAPSGFLMAKAYAGHETEIARLAGARMVVCSEINEGDRFDEAKVKQLTGGDALTARFMRADHFTFAPSHKLWLMGNHQPTVTGGGHSFWRRLRILPFTNTVPEDRAIEDLQGILAREEGAAVLGWIIAGAREYATCGLGEPDSVKAATAEYAGDQDTIARFVEDCCVLSSAAQTRMSVVLARYEQWCHAEGLTPVKARTLGMTLRSRFGVGADRVARHRFYIGIGLLADEDEVTGDRSSRRGERDDEW